MDTVNISVVENVETVTISIVTGFATVVNSDATYTKQAPVDATTVLPDVTHTDTNGAPTILPAMTPMVCTPASCSGVDVKNSDETYSQHVNDGATLVLPDTIVKNTSGTTILTQPSCTNTGVVADCRVVNSDLSYDELVPAETVHNLADVPNVDSDGSTVMTPAMTPFVATPGGWWQRPSDWLPIDNLVTAGDNKIVGLYAIFPSNSSEVAGNTLKLLCNFNYTVNWGDGLTENITAGVEAIHVYNFDDIDVGTLTTEGFKQAVVTITGNGNNMNDYVQLGRPSSLISCVNWLDLRVSGQSITSIYLPANYYSAFRLKKFIYIGATYNGLILYGPRSSQLRIFEIDYTNLSSLSFMFYGGASFDDMGDIISNASSIGYFMSGSYARKIGNVTLMSATSAAYAFSGCRVDEFGNIDLRAATSTPGIFQDSSVKKIGSINIATSNSIAWGFKCLELISPLILTTSALLADCSYAFCAAGNVPEISLSNASGITNTTGMFASCNRLAKLRLPGIKTSFSVAGCNMSADALNTLFGDVADLTGFPSQTLTYSSNPGAATADASILTAKNWIGAG